MLDTPKGLRLQIGIFGRRNTGKSSLINTLTRQSVSIVSDQPGTTTDPVEKAFELPPLGPVLFIDTAGIDDTGVLGEQRAEKTRRLLERVDLALVVTDQEGIGQTEEALLSELGANNIPVIVVINKIDLSPTIPVFQDQTAESVRVCALSGTGVEALLQAIIRHVPDSFLEVTSLIGDLILPGEMVLLVAPIDLSAPRGRLILPQVQTLRDILDNDACAVLIKESELLHTLSRFKEPPRLVVCDSQVVEKVAGQIPQQFLLTTFSILMSRFKGDMIGFAQGAGVIHHLRPGQRILIAEACAHHPQEDDIGRVKIPRLLSRFAGGDLLVDVHSGTEFPDDLSVYALIVQCGGCTVTRKAMLARQLRAKSQGIAMTNYGMAISVAQGVLERTLQCFPEAFEAYRQARV